MYGDEATRFASTSRCASPGGLLPAQVWDAAAIPGRGLFPGRPSGGAMPLVWAHSEFLKLLVARRDGRPVELLESVRRRYAGGPRRARFTRWRNETPVRVLAPGRTLLVEDRRPFTLHLGFDGWQDIEEIAAEALPFGLYGVTIDPARRANRTSLSFTRRYGDDWEGRDHLVTFATDAEGTTLTHRA